MDGARRPRRAGGATSADTDYFPPRGWIYGAIRYRRTLLRLCSSAFRSRPLEHFVRRHSALAATPLAAVTAVTLLLSACGSSDSDSTPAAGSSSSGLSGQITVFAAASLTGSFTALGQKF